MRKHHTPIAKWISRLPSKEKIVGSTPTGGTLASLAQLVRAFVL